MENEYFLIGSSTVSYTISGLPADTEVAIYLYSPNFTHFDSPNQNDQPNRGFALTANGETILVPSGFGTNNMLAFVRTDSSGDISGLWYTPNGNEGDWSGFQIATVPEPSSLALLGCGLGGLGFLAALRCRRNLT